MLPGYSQGAGSDPESENYYPEDDDYLLGTEKYTSMYDVFFQKDYDG